MRSKQPKRRTAKRKRGNKLAPAALTPTRRRSAQPVKKSRSAVKRKSGLAKATVRSRPTQESGRGHQHSASDGSSPATTTFPPESRRLHGKDLAGRTSRERRKPNLSGSGSPTLPSSRGRAVTTQVPRIKPRWSATKTAGHEQASEGDGGEKIPQIETITPEDRYNIAGLLTCLFNKRKAHDTTILRNLYRDLKLSEAQCDSLLKSAIDDPAPFARAIRSETTRSKVLFDLMVTSIRNGHYDARVREQVRQLAALLEIPWNQVTAVEDRLAEELGKVPSTEESTWQESPEARKKRWWKIATFAGSVAGLAAMATPFVAPAIGGWVGYALLGLRGAPAASAGLAALGGGSLAAGGFGVAGGKAAVGAVGSLFSALRVGRKMARRLGPLDEFRYVPLKGSGMHCFIAVPGFLTERSEPQHMWDALPGVAGHGAHYALVWESQHLYDLGKQLSFAAAEGVAQAAIHAFAKHASRMVAKNFRWPATVVWHAANVIDNPWSIAKDRAEKAAALLAKDLRERAFGPRPVTLIGFSLGARLIFRALEQLAEDEDTGKGIVDHVILLGGAFSADTQRWEKVRHIVAGRLVNAYSSNDWVLGFIYRAAEFELGAIAGLHPVNVQDVESIDVSRLVSGHRDYMKKLGELLVHIGVDGK